MPSALFVELRERVVAAVVEVASCHQAAARFGGSVSSAGRWSERSHREGQMTVKPSGGDHCSHFVEAHADMILATYEQRPEILLLELHGALAAHGLQSSKSGRWRFFRLHRITRK